ncbi:MAG TPA: inorganic phosphate transporter [Actinomycetota bacterium]|nr:inorganic phosphate transporter [Actinomycetota bacterium]
MSVEAWLIVLVALFFDFSNGFHDAANSIATVVSTRVLPPRLAVAWAAFWNFVAFLVFGTAVAKTIGSGIIDINQVASLDVILAAVTGAITWNIITWYYGIPSSSSHALVGGLIGAALVAAGHGALEASGITKTAFFIVVAPLLGFILGIVLMNVALWAGKHLTRFMGLAGTNTLFRRLQLVSAGAYSLGHGANDAQKTMGIIAAVLVVDQGRHISPEGLPIDLWVVLAAQAAIALGTLAGGWRIVHTLGSRITKLQPVGGFAAESGAALTLFGTAHFGIPVSTTQTITGSIVGVGTTTRPSGVRWGVTGRVVYAWILTIPCSGGIAAALWYTMRVIPAWFIAGLIIAAVIAWGAAIIARRRREVVEESVFAPPA